MAFATSSYLTLAKPEKVKAALKDSNIYNNFVANALEQGERSAGSNQIGGVVSLSDSAVHDAAKTAFTASLIESQVNTFIDSNYAWLEGKTDKPEFAIDLTGEKSTFAQLVGQYVQTRLTGLPVCSAAQQAALTTVDPLEITCRPTGLDPAAAGAQVRAQLEASNELLEEPVITPENLNPDNKSSGEPYYVALSGAPDAYQLGLKLPWIFAIIAALAGVAIVFVASRKRQAAKWIAIALTLAGSTLIIFKFMADAIFKELQNMTFNTAATGNLELSLTDFANRLESQLVKIDMYFGLAFLILAMIIFILLGRTRRDTTSISPPADKETAAGQSEASALDLPEEAPSKPLIPGAKRPRFKSKSPPKPPRLIQ